MPTFGDEIEPKQVLAVEVLLAGGTQIEAAEAAGVTRDVIRRWLKLPEVREAIKAGKAETLEAVNSKLLGAGITAVDTLVDLATNGKSEHVRARAASDTLNHLFRSQELNAIDDRLSELEARLAGALDRG